MDESMAHVNVMRLFQLHGIPQAVPSRMDMIIYRAAYADGMEAGAKIVEEGDYDTDIHAIAAIRQHAKEMGHE